MKIAAAQIRANEGDIPASLRDHQDLARQAADQGVSLLLFPEMSLTGYTRENASDLAFIPNDPRLDPLRQIATEHEMMIIAGAPLQIDNRLFISSLILCPDGRERVYSKQYLHQGEELYFSVSPDHAPVLNWQGHSISLAICYDIEVPAHAEAAGKAGTNLYLASIFYSMKSMDRAHEVLGRYAKEQAMAVLMANFCGTCWGMEAGGQSAYWDNQGVFTRKAAPGTPELLIVELPENWA